VVNPPGAHAKTLTTLVFAASASAREAAIHAAILHDRAQAKAPAPAPSSTLTPPTTLTPSKRQGHAVLLEGLPDGSGQLETLLANPDAPGDAALIRLAPGCLCCSGNLILRVSLNRLLRRKPARLFIALAATAHIGQLRTQLQTAPYDDWLTLDTDLDADAASDIET
jgi:hypothetical protein